MSRSLLATAAMVFGAGVVLAQTPTWTPPPDVLREHFPSNTARSPLDTLIPVQSQQSAPPAGGPSDQDGGYDNGNDPTKIRKRFSFRTDTTRFANALTVTTTTASVAFPILQEDKLKATFGFDLPMNYYEVERPIDTILSGIGDLKAQFIFVRPVNKTITAVFGTNIYFPTADDRLLELPTPGRFTDANLGTGKYRVEPLLGVVFVVSENLFVIPFYAHDMSFAGDGTAQSINRGTARLFVNYSLPQGWYLSSETQILINYNNGNDLDAFQRLEVGKAFKNGTVFYVKPGVGIDPGPFNREWGIEGGVRFVF